MSTQMQPHYLGIDIGGSAVKYGYGINGQQLICYERILLRDNTLQSLQIAIRTILETTDEQVGLGNLAGIGMGTPGTIDIKTGKLVGVNPNLLEWVNLDPACLFPVELRSRLHIDNDANLMALAEAVSAPEHSHVIGVTIGSGIGCGFVANRELYHGAHGFAMELGHNIAVSGGERCNCGKDGCLEAYASVNGLLNIIRKNVMPIPLSNMQNILDLAKREAGINTLIDRSLSYLSTAIANLAINLDADLIVLGGGVVELEDYPFDLLREKILDSLTELIKNKIVIRKARYGNRAGVIGAICLAQNADISVKGMKLA